MTLLFSSHRLPLEDEAVVLLWYRSLSSLEEAVLRLLGSALARTESTPQELELQTAQSLLVGLTCDHDSSRPVSDVKRTSADSSVRSHV